MQAGQKTPLPQDQRNPRTAIGVDGGGFLYMIVVDGRSENSPGMKLPELQAYVAATGLQTRSTSTAEGAARLWSQSP